MVKLDARKHVALVVMEEIQNLPSHFHDVFSQEFLVLVAALRLHGFVVLRADEVQIITLPNQNLYSELGHPSAWLQSSKAAKLNTELKSAEPGSPRHTKIINQIIRANLTDQKRLLLLLEEFYRKHTPSFWAKLIVETVDLGEMYLKSQGSAVRIILDSHKSQVKWAKDSQTELQEFATFLISKLE